MKTTTLLLISMSTCLLISSCQKSDLNENKDLLKASANAAQNSNGAKKKNLAVGDYYGGGIIVTIDALGEHGLIVCTKDLGTAPWGCSGIDMPGTSWDFGTGAANTDIILQNCNEQGIAARICHDLVVRENETIDKKGDLKETGKKYDDWFLPSSNEISAVLAMSFESNDPVVINLFPSGDYWTSNQGPTFWHGANPLDPTVTAFSRFYYSKIDLSFLYIIPQPQGRSALINVRAVRAF